MSLSRGLRRWLADRRLLTALDQAISSLSNLVIAVAVAHSVSVSRYGVYAIAASIYWVCLGSERALVGEPCLIFWADFVERYREHTGRIFGTGALGSGLVFGAPLVGAGIIVHEPAFWVLGLFMPILLWQDSLRYVMFSQRRPHLAIMTDCAWLATVAAVIAGVVISHSQVGLGGWLALWGAGAIVGCLALALPQHLAPSRHGIREVAVLLRATALQLWGDFVITQGAVQMLVLALPVVASLRLLGALKAAQVAYGPVNNALNAGLLLGIPAVATRARSGQFRAARALGGRVGMAGLGATAAYTVILSVLPRSVGHLFFGQTWAQASELLIWVGAGYSVGLLGAAALVVLRGSRQTQIIIRARLFIAPLTPALPLAGAAVSGSTGLGIGLVSAYAANSVVWWYCVRLTTARLEASAISYSS